MRDEVEKAMQSGAFGLSSGLLYAPGSFGSVEEVIELAKVAGEYGGIYITHMRNEALGVLDSVQETIRIGEEGGLPAQITHHKMMGAPMWGRSVDSLALVDAANARGLDVSIDQYPYPASSTNLPAVFPRWSLDGGDAAINARLDDPVERTKVKEGIVYAMINERGGNDPANVSLANCEWDPTLNGLNLSDVLRQREIEVNIENAAELIMDLQRAGGCMCVFHAMSMQDVDRIMLHPKTMIASDGGIIVPGVGVPHPRNYGSFARVLGHFSRERGLLPLSTAIHKMTRMPADRINLSERGRIEVDAYADIAVFDPDLIIDTATFENPHQYALGMHHVFVNGQAAMLNGEMTGKRPGRVLRSR
jgi:dihydroorotase/N-acyl-D-amino-acid deacylase